MAKRRKANGTFWLNKQNQLHRKGGPAAVTNSGSKYWFLNGKKHNPEGAAIVLADGTKMWLMHDQLHRLDGPAVKGPNVEEYWVEDKQYTKEEFYQKYPA